MSAHRMDSSHTAHIGIYRSYRIRMRTFRKSHLNLRCVASIYMHGQDRGITATLHTLVQRYPSLPPLRPPLTLWAVLCEQVDPIPHSPDEAPMRDLPPELPQDTPLELPLGPGGPEVTPGQTPKEF